jgi:SAM-dependent methyltransferase
MALAMKSQQTVECVEQFQRYLVARPLPSARCQGDPALSRSNFTTPEEVNEVYRRRARFYDWSVNTYYPIGFRWWAYRRRAIAALQLGRGATVVEIGCGTGLNFGLVQQRIGPTGRLFGVDLLRRYAGKSKPAGRS